MHIAVSEKCERKLATMHSSSEELRVCRTELTATKPSPLVEATTHQRAGAVAPLKVRQAASIKAEADQASRRGRRPSRRLKGDALETC